MKNASILLIALSLAPMAHAQQCSSIAAASLGTWEPIRSAPRDGTIIEVLETYGIAPTYALEKWANSHKLTAFNFSTGKTTEFIDNNPGWEEVGRSGHSYVENECLFWRSYRGDSSKYVDPTGGDQNKTAYWCNAMHRPYDAKKDRCL